MTPLPRLIVSALLSLFMAVQVQAASQQAIDGTASGKVQQVGFRAMILKQAIQYNLAGTARNTEEHTVQFSLQGKDKRLQDALTRIRRGTDKSADVKISTRDGTFDPGLRTFTVTGWTSTSRHITKPYNLVFTLRQDDKKISKKEAKQEYCAILKNTLDADDWKKAEPGCQAR
ncbi:acylphosphatase [Chromobacterium amazonense]|uniref:acylphosphatase n=1 Tax=Chromobacterium amazonense TaxID=1382803 RepID=A0ABU8UY85_9NEIS|nr:acylphosphatase [Chromobacterium amazonense]MDQ4540950.1 acylphosphatase [Chromobacterium amazonense]